MAKRSTNANAKALLRIGGVKPAKTGLLRLIGPNAVAGASGPGDKSGGPLPPALSTKAVKAKRTSSSSSSRTTSSANPTYPGLPSAGDARTIAVIQVAIGEQGPLHALVAAIAAETFDTMFRAATSGDHTLTEITPGSYQAQAGWP